MLSQVRTMANSSQKPLDDNYDVLDPRSSKMEALGEEDRLSLPLQEPQNVVGINTTQDPSEEGGRSRRRRKRITKLDLGWHGYLTHLCG